MGDRQQGTRTWVDALATPFDRAWRAGQRPRIEDCLAGAETSRHRQLLGELLRVELEYRREAGEAPTPEEYQRRFAAYPEIVAAAFAEQGTVSIRAFPTVGRGCDDPPGGRYGRAGSRIGPRVQGFGDYEILGEIA